MIMKRLSLVYPVITYRAKMKRNLGYVVNEDWIIGQLYTDAVGKKYLLAGTPENEDQQRFYEVTNLRQETVGILSPFRTNHENAIFDGDIISFTVAVPIGAARLQLPCHCEEGYARRGTEGNASGAISSTVEGCRTNQLTSYIRDCRC